MSKKDEAFGLFSQGKTPTDPEVLSLGLVQASIQRHYRLWKQLNPQLETPVIVAPPVTVSSEVLLGNLPNEGLFEYGGQVYKKRSQVYSGQVVALLMNKAAYTEIYTSMGESVYLPPSIIVTPK